ncbi:MAG: hypothetical protein OEV28_07130 [Nitrospirota bacterium]|nr:hypothetical protein [Nitrospirota bacterium]
MERPIEQNIITNERGTILLVVLIMLVLLSTLGAMSFLNSTTELNTSGEFRKENATFYEADKALEYAITDDAIYTVIPMTEAGGGSFPASTATPGQTASAGLGTMDVVNKDGRIMAKGRGAYSSMTVRVEHLKTGPLPPGTGDEDIFQGAYFYASVVGEGPDSGERTIEGQFARKVPK